MWKYIVTWCLVITHQGIPFCELDEFDRIIKWNYDTYTINECNHEAIFTNKNDALAFIERASFENDVENVILDSIEVDTSFHELYDSLFVMPDSVWKIIVVDTISFYPDTTFNQNYYY